MNQAIEFAARAALVALLPLVILFYVLGIGTGKR